MNRELRNGFIALAIFSVVAIALAPLMGITWISPQSYFGSATASASSADFDRRVLWEMRLPRVLAAFFVGGMLALGGTVFQVLFRNPLATPFTLGVSAGAALGVALATVLALPPLFGTISTQTIAAFLGAGLSIGIVLLLGRCGALGRGIIGAQSGVLLLAGVAMSYLFSSLVLLLQYVSNLQQLFRTSRWLIGSLIGFSYDEVSVLAGVGVATCIVVIFFGRELDLMACGEEFAAARGVAVRRVQTLLVLLVSLMIAIVVTFCGVIGFVGLMIPHLCRRTITLNHRPLALASFIAGGTFLVLADTVSRTLFPPYEIPVSILTALLGGPFFLWILLRASIRGENHSW